VSLKKESGQKKLTASEQQIRLQKDSESKKRKRSEETDTNRKMRLEKERKLRARKLSQPQHEINQQDYLNMFDNTNNGVIEEQCWAKANINKFNKSVQYASINQTNGKQNIGKKFVIFLISQSQVLMLI
jgi:hypothetical protein